MTQNQCKPVTVENYGNKYWKRFTSFEFAQTVSDCPVVETEIFPVAAAFPTAFRRTGEEVEPVALFTLHAKSPNPFVSDTGAWVAPYVPSALRCLPFFADRVSNRAGNQFQLMVDESLGLVSDNPKDEVFFDKTGALSSELRKVQSFFQARLASVKRTRAICEVLSDLNLFDDLQEHEGYNLPPGFLGISQTHLDALSPEEKTQLAVCGALRLVHAHQISLSHVPWLAHAQTQVLQNKHLAKLDLTPDAGRFLGAIANAQIAEGFLSESARDQHAYS